MEVPAHGFITVFAATTILGALQTFIDRKVKDQGQIGPKITDHHTVEVIVHRTLQTVPIALISEGGVGKAVGDDPGAPLKRRPHQAAKVIPPCGEVQKRLGEAIPSLPVTLDQEAADFLGTRAAAWFPRGDDLPPARLEMGDEFAELGGFPSALPTFQGYETPAFARHIWIVAARGPSVN